MTLRERIAARLRGFASAIDGEGYINSRWHRLNVRSTNRYVGQTERYIVDLEAMVDPVELARLRQKHRRFDTRPLIVAGAWPEVDGPGQYGDAE